MAKYTIIIEKTNTGYSAYVPDLPGCITVGDTIDQVKDHMKEAIQLYIEELKLMGKKIPEPSTRSDVVKI
jgi:predicted RNase H-like HicB family nuclease